MARQVERSAQSVLHALQALTVCVADWAAKHNTWEPEEHLKGCEKIKAKFDKQWQKEYAEKTAAATAARKVKIAMKKAEEASAAAAAKASMAA